MRDLLNKSLEMLIWLATIFFIISACYAGAMIIRHVGDNAILGGFIFIIFGVTMSFVFAGICFQIMDIRTFTKYSAMNVKRGNQ